MLHPLSLILSIIVVAGAMAHANAQPLWPAAGDRVVADSAIVGSEFERELEESPEAQARNFRSFVDVGSGVRIYHRDGGLLFAVTTRRNLSLREKIEGERVAAGLAHAMLQQKFSHLLGSHDGFKGLDARAVRVVFVEPDAFSPYVRPGSATCGRGCQGGGSNAVGGNGGPMAFAPSGFWAGGSTSWTACTGCRCN